MSQQQKHLLPLVQSFGTAVFHNWSQKLFGKGVLSHLCFYFWIVSLNNSSSWLHSSIKNAQVSFLLSFGYLVHTLNIWVAIRSEEAFHS